MPTEIPVTYPGFEGRRLTVRTAGWFSGIQLQIDGAPVKPQKRLYLLRDNAGKEVQAKFGYNYIDPVPMLKIDGNPILLARPLTWYEYAWMGAPILLLFVGGALGALFGMWGAWTSGRIFRSDRGTAVKYLLTGAVSLAAVFGYLVLATIALSFFGSGPGGK